MKANCAGAWWPRRAAFSRDNLDDDELSDLKRIGQAYLAMSGQTVLQALSEGELQEINYGEAQAP